MATPIKSISKDLFAQAGRLSKWGNVALWTATGILVADFLLGGYKQQIPHWNTALVVQALLLAAYSFLILGSSIVMAKARRVKINDVVDNAFGTDIGSGHSEGYFDNDEIKRGTLRLLYNTAESCFFTCREMKNMTTSVYVKAFIPMTILVLGLVLTALIVFIGGYKTNFFNRNLACYGLVELNSKQRSDYYCIKGWNNSFAKLGLDFDVVFFGNSITAGSDFREYFPEVSICNLGYPGDEIDGMILRIPAIKGIHLKKLFLMAGINGLKQMSEEVFKDKYKSLIMALKDSLPGPQIYLQSILSVNNTDFKVAYVDNGKIEKANNITKELANKNGCNYINFYDLYVREGQMPKELSRDGLHLRPEAYSIWAEAIRPYMR